MEKKTLKVDCVVSKKIAMICSISKILHIISSIVGGFLIVIGLSDNEDDLVLIGISVLGVSILTLLATLPLLRGFAKIVESAEYTKANFEMYYYIEEMMSQQETQEV